MNGRPITHMPMLGLLCIYASIAAFNSGCQRVASPGKPVVKITCTCPGAGPELTDSLIHPLVEKLLLQPGLEQIRTISREGIAEIYVIGVPGTAPSDLQTRASTAADQPAKDLSVIVVGQGIKTFASEREVPVTIQSQLVERIEIELDREKLAMMGISRDRIDGLLSRVDRTGGDSPDAIKRISDTPLPLGDKQVRLGDVATIRRVKAPDCIVRIYP